MLAYDRIPECVLSALRESGTDPDTVELAVRADRTRELIPGDTYLFATKDALVILEGRVKLLREERRLGRLPRLSEEWDGSVLRSYSLQEFHRFHIEEMLSAGRLVAKRKTPEGEGETAVLLASFTNFCKDSMLLFSKYAEKLASGVAIEADPKDDPASKCCPKCGLRYPDLNRRICPRCMEKGKLFWRFASFFGKYWRYLVMSVISLVFLTAMSILAPYLSSGFFYDEVIYGTGEFAGELLLVLGIIVGTRLLRVVTQVINGWVTSTVAAKVVFDLKKTIFSAIERLSLSFFTGRQTGGLMTQVNEDANTIYGFFCDGLPYLLISVVEVVVLVVLLFCIQPVLAALALCTVPIFIVMLRGMFRRERLLHGKRYSGSRQMNAFLGDVFSGMRVVKAFSKEEEEIKRFTGKNERLADSEKRMSLFINFAWPAAHQVLALGNILVWGVGGWMIFSGTGGMTYGLLLTFISYINMVFDPLVFFVDFLDWTADCTNALQRLFEIMDTEPEVAQREDPLAPDPFLGSVEFDRVSFSYQKGKRVIDDVSFSVADGEILGIVGHTGAGKSTLANLLMRMYDAEEGEIRIGGIPVKDLELATLYRNIAIVSQETYLFMGTILENIRYASPNASFEEVVAASKCAGAHDFIMKLPDAYDTKIGFGYKDLSGGERQRVSIARAILKNPKILILDEATAAMDTGTERRIQAALGELIKGKTTIMIAHRLSTLRDADKLVVIEHGKVVEEGTHEALLEAESGVYKKLYTLQAEALKSAGISE